MLSVQIGKSFFFPFSFSLLCLFCMVSGLFKAILNNFLFMWETLLSPLFFGYMGTLGVFMLRGLLGGEGVPPRLYLTIFKKKVFYSNG